MDAATPPLTFRPWTAQDDLAQLTALIRAAYAPHAASGLKYWATHQSESDTAQRIAHGTCWLAVQGTDYVATAVVCPPQSKSPVALYNQPGVWTLSQFCVNPAYKGQGAGKALHQYLLTWLTAQGATTLALDTAALATALIQRYQSWGYQIVGDCDWRPFTNYPSVVMALSLSASEQP
jgi:GNAT superfamily N-acetyltransferase